MHMQTCLWLLFYLHCHVMDSVGFSFGLKGTLCYGFNDTNGIERCFGVSKLISQFWSTWLRTFRTVKCSVIACVTVWNYLSRGSIITKIS